MSQPLVLGIDLGGGGLRCLLVDAASGDVVAGSHRSWSFTPAPGLDGLGFDLDLDAVWRLLREALVELLQRSDTDASDIGGVAVSAMRFASVILDRDGQAIFAVPNRDIRAAAEHHGLSEQHGERFNAATGLWPLSIHLPARLLWLRRHQPDVLERAATAFSFGDWLNFRLCGARVTDLSQAGCSSLFNAQRQAWDADLLATLKLNEALLPEVKPAGSAIGRLDAGVAAELGLAEGTVVGLGGADSQCGLLGVGAIEPGDLGCIAGTTAPVMAVTDRPVIDGRARTWSGSHLMPGRWVIESSGGPMGETLSWMARMLFPQSPQPELRIFGEAARSDYGARGMLSTLGAQVMNGRAPSLPVGAITLSHMASAEDPDSRRHLCRALVEGYACGVRANVEQLAAVTGTRYSRLYLGGGFARSPVFAQLLADIGALEVIRGEPHQSSALGAAACAAVAAHHFADLASADRALGRTAPALAPMEPGGAAQQVYRHWNALREAGAETTDARAAEHAAPFVFAPAPAAAGTGSGTAHRPGVLVTADFDAASLERLGAELDVEYQSFREKLRMLSGRSLVRAMQGKQVLVTEVDLVDARALQDLPELRVVAACRGNAVNVDIDACSAFGVPVLYAPGRNAEAVADLTVALMLALARKLPDAAQFLEDPSVTAGDSGKMAKAFATFQGRELWGKTIGLVGLGAVGRAVAGRLRGFGARVIVADPFATPESAALADCELVELSVLLREADVVSLHAAVTPDTAGLIGADEFGQMKAGAYFINTARAALVDEDALVEALASEHLAGAALDTFNREPPGWDHPLVQHPRVITTPHVAGNTREVARHQGESISRALLQLLAGEHPENCLNPEVLEDFSWTCPRKTLDESAVEALMQKASPAVTDLERRSNAQQPARPAVSADDQVTAADETVERVRALFESFCERLSADEKARAAAEGTDVRLAFSAPDVGLDFSIGLSDGVVDARMGLDESSEVSLSMRAATLDAMFQGKLDTMKASMEGEIAFVGDAAKAMALQGLQRHMKRIYTAVREESRDPGDLEAIPRPGGAPAVLGEAGRKDIREQLVAVVDELYEHHIITATGGNVSVRIPDAPEQCWITPSQMFKGDLRPDSMVRIDLAGKPLDPGSRSPSSEWGFHTATLRKKPEAQAVIHAHAPNATILANTGLPFLPVSTDAAFFGEIQRIPFTMPGSDELAELVSEALREEWAVLMVNHGIVVAGRSLRRACDMAQIIERTAEVILGCYQTTGEAPPVLPEAAVKMFRSMKDIIA